MLSSLFPFFPPAGVVPEPAYQVAQEARGRNGHGQAETGGAGRWRRRLQRTDGLRLGELGPGGHRK